jgi:hypothetical protein
MAEFLRKVDTTTVKRYSHTSGDWVDLREHLSKREVNAILRVMPSGVTDTDKQSSGDMVDMVAKVAETLFTNLVVAWSADENPSVETYLSMTTEAASWIDGVLFEHFNAQSIAKDESGKR